MMTGCRTQMFHLNHTACMQVEFSVIICSSDFQHISLSSTSLYPCLTISLSLFLSISLCPFPPSFTLSPPSFSLLPSPTILLSSSLSLLLPQDGLSISHHADHTLNSFCQWQAGLSGREGQRHDHAILLTGLDICSWKNEPCDTLGTVSKAGTDWAIPLRKPTLLGSALTLTALAYYLSVSLLIRVFIHSLKEGPSISELHIS